jgi:putative ABC transport system permease protein
MSQRRIYGLGILLLTAVISGVQYSSPYYAATITFWNLWVAFGMVLPFAAISGYIGVRKVLKIEPFDIFRG